MSKEQEKLEKYSAYDFKKLAEDLVTLGKIIEDYKESKTIAPAELQPLVKAIFELNQRMDDLEAKVNRLLPPPLRKQKVEEDPKPITEIMSEMDRKIREALEKHAGNRRLAAEELGMSERTLYRKLPAEYRKR